MPRGSFSTYYAKNGVSLPEHLASKVLVALGCADTHDEPGDGSTVPLQWSTNEGGDDILAGLKDWGEAQHQSLMDGLPSHHRRTGVLEYIRALRVGAGFVNKFHFDEPETGDYHLVIVLRGGAVIRRYDLVGTHRFQSDPDTGYFFDGSNVHGHDRPLEGERIFVVCGVVWCGVVCGV